MDSGILTAIASPRRREILRLTWDDERSAGDIARAMPDVTFGAVSLQIGELVKTGLLDVRSDHPYRYYRARRSALGAVRPVLERMWDDALWRLKLEAELERTRRGPKPRGSRNRSSR
jgi:DNA-binding transcriptional ArsR family regulator